MHLLGVYIDVEAELSENVKTAKKKKFKKDDIITKSDWILPGSENVMETHHLKGVNRWLALSASCLLEYILDPAKGKPLS